VSHGPRSAPSRAVAGAVPHVLVVAGSDPTGGAGLQADIKTLEHFGVAAAAVVTTVTAQSTRRVMRAQPIEATLVRAQISAALESISPRVVKCGLLGNEANARVVAGILARRRLPLVLDPVTVASAGGRRLAPSSLLAAIVERLFPLATVVTVNIAEATRILGRPVRDEEAMRRAAADIARLGPEAVVVKGGHLSGDPVDVLYADGAVRRFRARRVEASMHGTGCAFASALAAGLAYGRSLERAVSDAGAHVRALLVASIRENRGSRLRVPLRGPRKTR
jgi:hydroxymethylpyrimidine kinase/phosphomethylpyrimidine kinase